MKRAHEMTVGEQFAALGASRDAQDFPAPPGWREWTETSEDGQDWLYFELTGWVLACTDEGPDMCGLPADDPLRTPVRHHFVLSSAYIPESSPGHWEIKHTGLGGVCARVPSYVRDARAHVRLFHAMSDLLPYHAWRSVECASGTPIQVRVVGHCAKVPPGPGIAQEVWDATSFVSFHRPDFRCPTIVLENAEMKGTAKTKERDIFHFRLPFTRWHLGISSMVWAYHRPDDPEPEPTRAPQQVTRQAQFR